MMLVVLDTNIIVGDFHLSGTAARVFLQQLPRSSHALHMPQIVIDEVVNKYRSEWEQLRRNTEKPRKETAKRVQLPIEPMITPAQVDQRVDEYRTELRNRLASVSATVVPYPKTPHDKLARREMERKRPFSETGAGYRDSLIWETVLEILDGTEQVVALITADKDFADKNGQLYPELLDDLTARGIRHDRVRVFKSLDDFIRQEVKPDFERLEDIRAKLDAGDYPGLDLAGVIETQLEYEELPAARRGYEELGSGAAGVGLPDYAEDPTLVHAEIEDDVCDVNVLDVRETSSGELLIDVEADAEALFDFYVFKPDWRWFPLPDDDNVGVVDSDWNDHYMLAETLRQVRMGLSLTYDPSSASVTSIELHSIEAIE
jgi:predicted nucleic acid-binding protein